MEHRKLPIIHPCHCLIPQVCSAYTSLEAADKALAEEMRLLKRTVDGRHGDFDISSSSTSPAAASLLNIEDGGDGDVDFELTAGRVVAMLAAAALVVGPLAWAQRMSEPAAQVIHRRWRG